MQLFVVFFWANLLLSSPCWAAESTNEEANVAVADDTNVVTVQTATGQIRGKVHRIGGNGDAQPHLDFDIFFGVPYAQSPVGPLRFEKTKPLPLDGHRVVDAFEQPKVCVPHHRLDNYYPGWSDMAEDCLFLNIFTPHQQKEGEQKALLPTLLLVYTGGFEFQSMRRYQDYEEIARKFLARGIAVMAVQFRIGYFGFSSTGDAQMPGNFGYWDVAEALRWIRANGPAFGADPNRLTLFGYSSGGTMVSTLAVAPATRDFFQQAIHMSGPVFTSRGHNNRVVTVTRRLAELLQCPGSDDSAKLKQCFQQKSIGQFMDATDKLGTTVADVNYDLFGPVLDGDFLTADFDQLINETTPKRTILGLTEADPLGYTLAFGNNSLRHLAIPKEEFANFGAHQFRAYLRQKVVKVEYFGARRKAALDRLVDFYLEGYDRPMETDNWFYLERIVHVLTDIQFVVPLVAELRAKRGWPLFVYQNKYVNKRRFPDGFPLQKSFHDNDHMYLFRYPFSPYKYDANDERMEALLVDFMANFISQGTPSSTSALAVDWPMATSQSPLQCLHIQLPRPESNANCFSAETRVRFWEQMAVQFPEYNLVLGRPADSVTAAADGMSIVCIQTLAFLSLLVIFVPKLLCAANSF